MTTPFTHPYTAPDGSTRRPLAERVPKIVPSHCDGCEMTLRAVTIDDIHLWLWASDEQLSVSVPRYIDGKMCEEYASLLELPENAVARWRVAAEDWILKRAGLHWTYSGVLDVTGWRGGSVASIVEAQTRADALNAAAHAVADALGVEP